MLELVVVLNVVALLANGWVFCWQAWEQRQRDRALRQREADLAGLIGFVAAISEDPTCAVPAPIRLLARHVLPTWAKPLAEAVAERRKNLYVFPRQVH